MIKLENVKKMNIDEYDEVWSIVRSDKNVIPRVKFSEKYITTVNNIPTNYLSPSYSLFSWYCQEQKAGRWNKEKFFNEYVPKFIKELKNNYSVTRLLLNELYKRDKEGKRIALICFCENETTCHRSIIGGILQGVKANVKTANDADYSTYYNMFVEEKNQP